MQRHHAALHDWPNHRHIRVHLCLSLHGAAAIQAGHRDAGACSAKGVEVGGRGSRTAADSKAWVLRALQHHHRISPPLLGWQLAVPLGGCCLPGGIKKRRGGSEESGSSMQASELTQPNLLAGVHPVLGIGQRGVWLLGGQGLDELLGSVVGGGAVGKIPGRDPGPGFGAALPYRLHQRTTRGAALAERLHGRLHEGRASRHT